MLLSLFAAPLALLATTVSAYSNPLSCSGICTNTHDPAVIRRTVDGKYFRFATGGGIAIHTSSGDIQGPWSYAGVALSGGSKIANSGAADMWAPDVSYVNGLYYLYYAVSSFGTQNSVIGLATSDDMEVGSWTDHGSIGISSDSSKAYNAIDPNLLIAQDGTYQMNFGSFWHDIYQAPMKSSLTAISGSSTNIAYMSTGTHNIEGSFVMYRSGYYYLFFSKGQCCGYDTSKPAAGGEYKVQVCRSTSYKSGFVDKNGVSCLSGGGTTVLESHGTIYGPGGQSVYQDHSLGWVLVYHYVDTTIGYSDGDKRLGINKISWSSGWPTV